MKLLIVFVAVIQGCLSANIRQSCPLFCIENYDPVCGTDGVTYSNACKLHIATCHDSSIALDHDGACDSVKLPDCPPAMCFALYDPVCGSDGQTYSNTCTFHSANCHNQLTIVHKGPCDLVVS